MEACGWDTERDYCVLKDCQRSARCSWGVTVLPHPTVFFDAQWDRPVINDKLAPGKSRRLPRRKPPTNT
jgi:hypothetical protein